MAGDGLWTWGGFELGWLLLAALIVGGAVVLALGVVRHVRIEPVSYQVRKRLKIDGQ